MGRLVLKRETNSSFLLLVEIRLLDSTDACYLLYSLGAYYEPTSSSQLVTVGPFGGTGGTSWNDEVHTLIRQLIIYSLDVVKSIQVEYDDKGESKWSAVHGRQSGTMSAVELDYPNEFLVPISGYYCKNGSDVDIHSLKFESNIKTYGPFGTERGQAFKVPASSGNKIIGFFGKLSCHVHSIGAYYEPFFVSSLSKLSSIHGWRNGTIHKVSLILISNIFLSHATIIHG